MTGIKPGEMVVVTWRDSSAPSRIWNNVADAKAYQPVKVRSVGFIASWDKVRVVLFQSFHEDEVGGVFAIPHGSIIEIRKLAEGDEVNHA